jgi:hypothetical protein
MFRVQTCFGVLGVLAAQMPQTATAQSTQTAPASAQGDVSVTIYADMALIEDTRTVAVPAGTSRQEFSDVSATIRPETVTLAGDGVEIVEQNFDFDLLSPEAMMRKAEGQSITLLRTNEATGAQTREQAKVLAVNGGVVMQVGDHIEILRDDGLPVRVLFDKIPPNLRARPTLSVTLDSTKSGARPLTLSYLSSGLGWKADYVGLFDEGKQTMDLQGWVTLTNTSGTPFNNAKLTLAAGDVLKLNQRPAQQAYAYAQQGRDQDSDEKRVGDLYLYPVDGRTTISTNQKKQVSFLDVSAVAAKRTYMFECSWMCRYEDPVSATASLNFSTGKKGGIGAMLPAGVVRVYMRDPAGKARFVGESKINHIAAGSDVEMPTSLAFDVKVHPIIDKRERVTEEEWTKTAQYRIITSGKTEVTQVQQRRELWRTEMRYTLTNQRGQPVIVEVRQKGLQGWYQGTRVTKESITGQQDGSDVRTWQVPVAAGGKTELTVTYLSSF